MHTHLVMIEQTIKVEHSRRVRPGLYARPFRVHTRNKQREGSFRTTFIRVAMRANRASTLWPVVALTSMDGKWYLHDRTDIVIQWRHALAAEVHALSQDGLDGHRRLATADDIDLSMQNSASTARKQHTHKKPQRHNRV